MKGEPLLESDPPVNVHFYYKNYPLLGNAHACNRYYFWLKPLPMPSPAEFKASFFCGHFYHIVFKSIDGVLLFRDQENKIFFLNKFVFFLNPVSECWTYCLLDNHAHFIVRIKDIDQLIQSLSAIAEERRTISMKNWLLDNSNEFLIDEIIERQVNRFMVSYTNSYNKVFVRKGGLFQSPFRRSLIAGETHLQQAIIYVHANAQKHGLTSDYRSYLFSSYTEILQNNFLLVDVKKVLDFFGGMEIFIQQHLMQIDHFYSRNCPNSKIE